MISDKNWIFDLAPTSSRVLKSLVILAHIGAVLAWISLPAWPITGSWLITGLGLTFILYRGRLLAQAAPVRARYEGPQKPWLLSFANNEWLLADLCLPCFASSNFVVLAFKSCEAQDKRRHYMLLCFDAIDSHLLRRLCVFLKVGPHKLQ